MKYKDDESIIPQWLKDLNGRAPNTPKLLVKLISIGPVSDHCWTFSLTAYLTNSCVGDLIDVTLALEDTYPKLFNIVADVMIFVGFGYGFALRSMS